MSNLSNFVRREAPYFIFLGCFLVVLGGYYFNVPVLKTIEADLRNWSTLVTSTALFLGLANIAIYNIRTIQQKKKGEWQFSIYVIALTFVWIILGLYWGGLASPEYQNMYVYIKAQCWAAQIGLLTFFFASAAHRTFRANNVQGLVLLVFAFIAIIAVAPWGEQLWPGFPAFGAWVLDNPTMAASRAIIISASIGLVAMIVRIVLRYERGGLGRE